MLMFILEWFLLSGCHPHQDRFESVGDGSNNHTRTTGVNQDGGRSVGFCGRLGLQSWREFAYARLGGLAGRAHGGNSSWGGSAGRTLQMLTGKDRV